MYFPIYWIRIQATRNQISVISRYRIAGCMVRRGEADAKLKYIKLDDLSADEKDAVFVRFVRTAMVEKCGSS